MRGAFTDQGGLFSCREAAFREDFRLRCYRGPVDNLSGAFRKLSKKRKQSYRVRLEEEVFEAWKEFSTVDLRTISELKSAFKLRHWIAHGRYWDANAGRKYDFFLQSRHFRKRFWTSSRFSHKLQGAINSFVVSDFSTGSQRERPETKRRKLVGDDGIEPPTCPV